MHQPQFQKCWSAIIKEVKELRKNHINSKGLRKNYRNFENLSKGGRWRWFTATSTYIGSYCSGQCSHQPGRSHEGDEGKGPCVRGLHPPQPSPPLGIHIALTVGTDSRWLASREDVFAYWSAPLLKSHGILNRLCRWHITCQRYQEDQQCRHENDGGFRSEGHPGRCSGLSEFQRRSLFRISRPWIIGVIFLPVVRVPVLS